MTMSDQVAVHRDVSKLPGRSTKSRPAHGLRAECCLNLLQLHPHLLLLLLLLLPTHPGLLVVWT